MWDLQALIAQNNRVAIKTMMAGELGTATESLIPDAWPLTYLTEKLKVGPPLLSEIVNGLTDIGLMTDFLNLVRSLLPDHEGEILSLPRRKRVYRFCQLFKKKYYPLPGWSQTQNVSEFTSSMPVEILGMSYDTYHELELRKGYAILLSLVVYPYRGDERDLEDDDVPFDPFRPDMAIQRWQARQSDIKWFNDLLDSLSDGGMWQAPMGFVITKINRHKIRIEIAKNTPEVAETIKMTIKIAEFLNIEVEAKVGQAASQKVGSGIRQPLLDLVSQYVGDRIAKLIPDEGWLPEELHQATDNTKYAGVGEFADWVHQQTGCAMLDTNYESVDWADGSIEPYFEWTISNVERLTAEWPKVQEFRRKIDHIVDWVEVDAQVRFGELVNFLRSRINTDRDDRRLPDYDQFSHHTILDQLPEEIF